MSIYDKILVGVDGSRDSIHAAEQALKLLRGKGRMMLLTVVNRDYLEYHGEKPENLDRQDSSARKAMLQNISEVADKGRTIGIDVELKLVHGKVFEEITDHAKSLDADAVVLGASHQGEVRRRFIGGTATKVIGLADRDVVVVPEKAEIALKKIVAATDGSSYGQIAVRRAVDLARDFGAKLEIISVVEESAGFPANVTFPGGKPMANVTESSADVPRPSFEDYLEKKVAKVKKLVEEERDRARHEGVKAEIVVPTGKPWRVLVKETENMGAGLIVMGSHGRTGLKRLVMGSVTQRVIEHSGCPVLVVRTR